MSELKLIDTYEVELCSDEPIEIEKFKIKTVSIDRSELQIGQYVFLKDQGKDNPDNGIYYVQSETVLAKVAVNANAYMVHIISGLKNRHAIFLWSRGKIRRLDLNTDKLAAGNFITKQGDELIAIHSIPGGSIVGTTEPQVIKNKTMDALENKFKNLESIFNKITASKIDGDISGKSSNITGLLSVVNGGTGSCVLHANRFLVGNGNNPISVLKTVPDGDVLGTTDFQNVTNKVINGQLNTIQGISSDSIISLDAKKILGDIIGRAENINGVLDVKHGGTGLSNLPANSVIVTGPTENPTILSTQPAPISAFVGKDDEQTFTNKTLSAKQNKIMDLSDENVTQLSGSKIVSDIHFKAAGLTNTLPVQNGGTGVIEFEPNCFMQSGHSLEVITRKKVPLSDVVGTTDEQTFTNKTMDAAQNSIKNISDAHVAWLSGSKIRGNISGMAEAISGTNDVTHGGTGKNNLPLDCVLVGNNSQSIKCDMKAPKSDFAGISDEQTFTNKTMDARKNNITGISSNNITTIDGSLISSDIEHNAKNVTGVVDIHHGGTGLLKFEARRFLTTGENSEKFLTEKVVPIGEICGTTDQQTLKNKIMDAEYNTFVNIGDKNIDKISGSKIVGNIDGGAAFVHSVVSVANGGTGLTKIAKGHMIIGSGDAICETRLAPYSELAGVSDIQTFTEKTMDGKLNKFTNIDDASILSISGLKVVGDIPGNSHSINSVLPIARGGTGLTKIPTGELLMGNGAIFEFKKAPEGDIVGTTDNQSITNKIIDGQKNALFNISGESIINIPGSKIQGNIPGNSSGIYGILDVTNGGTGLKEIPNGVFLTGEENVITTRHKIPRGDICGTDEIQTIKNKTIDANENKIENLADKNIVQLSGSKITGDIYGMAGGISGIMSIDHGGTGGKTPDEARRNLCAASSGHNKDIKSIENIDFISFKNNYTNGVKLCVQPYSVDWNFFLPAVDGFDGYVLTTNGYGITEWSPGVPCLSKVGYVDAQHGMANGRCRKTIREIISKDYSVIQIAPGIYRESGFLKGHIKGLSRKEVILSGNFVICKGSIVEDVTFENSKLSIENDCLFVNCRFRLHTEQKNMEQYSTDIRDPINQQVITLLAAMESQIVCGKKTEFKYCEFTTIEPRMTQEQHDSIALRSYPVEPIVSCSNNTFFNCSFDICDDFLFIRGNVLLQFCQINCKMSGGYIDSCSIKNIEKSTDLTFLNAQTITFENKFVTTQKILIIRQMPDNTKINNVICGTLHTTVSKGSTIEIEGINTFEFINLPPDF